MDPQHRSPDTDTDPLRTPVEIPPVGETRTLQKGELGLLLEHNRAGLCLRTGNENGSNGSVPLGGRHFLGLAKGGSLELLAQAPDLPVRIELLDPVTLTPGGRLRGYLLVPLPHRLVWRQVAGSRAGRKQALLNVVPHELRTAWAGEGKQGGYQHEARSRFLVSREEAQSEVCAMVPVVLHNDSDISLSPVQLTLRLRGRDLRGVGEQIVAAPRRLRLRGDSELVEEVRPFLRVSPTLEIEVAP